MSDFDQPGPLAKRISGLHWAFPRDDARRADAAALARDVAEMERERAELLIELVDALRGAPVPWVRDCYCEWCVSSRALLARLDSRTGSGT